jgi:hypothetical protein
MLDEQHSRAEGQVAEAEWKGKEIYVEHGEVAEKHTGKEAYGGPAPQTHDGENL